MKLAIKLELQDDAGNCLVMGGNTLTNPTEREVRDELFVLGERMLVFMAEQKREAAPSSDSWTVTDGEWKGRTTP